MFTRPDNSVYPSRVITSDIDNAELAARLGINRIRRGGRVVFYDDFGDSGLAWELTELVGGVCRVYTEYAYYHPFTPPGMLVMYPGGGATPYNAYANIYFPLAAFHNMGIEVTFKQSSPGANFLQYLTFQLNGGGYEPRVRADTANQFIQIQDKSGTWLDIVNYFSFDTWSNFKLVVDTELGIYKYIEYNRDIYDLNSNLPIGGSTLGALGITATDSTTKNYGALIDNVIITTEESLR